MDFCILKKKTKNKMSFHPLTIILINIIIPSLNTLLPSDITVFFTIIFALTFLLAIGRYRRLMKTIIWLLVFFAIYRFILLNFATAMLVSFFRMLLIFVPSIIFASILVIDYNSSELLSALQLLKLPKIFIIGLTVTLRYIKTFKNEFRLIKEAMYVRNVRFSLSHPIRSFEYLLVPQLFRCLNLSSELTCAGLTKGIDSPYIRTSYYTRKFSPLDYMALIILFVGYFMVWRWLWWSLSLKI